MWRMDLPNEIVTTLNTVLTLINVHIKESHMQQHTDHNIIPLRLPVRSSKAILMRNFMDSIHALEPWQKGQILASLRNISKIIYGAAEECVIIAEIIKALEK